MEEKYIRFLIIFFVFSSNLFASPSIKDVLTTDDQRELFGWDLVKMVLVERMDNLACPLPFDQMPAVLGESTVLSSRVLGTSQRISFENGAGYISLK